MPSSPQPSTAQVWFRMEIATLHDAEVRGQSFQLTVEAVVVVDNPIELGDLQPQSLLPRLTGTCCAHLAELALQLPPDQRRVGQSAPTYFQTSPSRAGARSGSKKIPPACGTTTPRLTLADITLDTMHR